MFNPSLAALKGLVSGRTVPFVLMAAILFLATGIFYKILTLRLMDIQPAATAAEKVRSTAVLIREPADAYRIIPERNLFGTTTKAVMEETPAAAAVQPQIDAAQLIELKGTIAGESPYGFAIIEEKATKKQRLVKAGDLIDRAKVIRIKRNAIDLLVGEQEQTLKIVETNEAPILGPMRPPILQQSRAAPAPSGATIVSRNEIDAGLQDMGTLLRQAQVRPYFNAGVPDGFLITNIQAGSLYRRMGIMDGDIIQKINDKPIQTADDMTGLLNTLKSSPNISLTIKRRGNQETLHYRIQ